MLMADATKTWTLEELHSLPDDGNKYELVRGALLVTPAPTLFHEIIAARLTRVLDPYVAEHSLGYVFRPRAVVRTADSEVEPDLLVWKPGPIANASWDAGPPPSLVVEILSPYTRRRDREVKREVYIVDRKVAEYWIVDPDASSVTRVRAGRDDESVRDTLVWHPVGASRALVIDLEWVFSRS